MKRDEEESQESLLREIHIESEVTTSTSNKELPLEVKQEQQHMESNANEGQTIFWNLLGSRAVLAQFCSRLYATTTMQRCRLVTNTKILIISFLLGLTFFQIFQNVQVSYGITQHLNNVKLTQETSPSKTTASDDEYDYEEIYIAGSEHESYRDMRLLDFQNFENYTSPDVGTNSRCRLTVTLVEPRLPPNGYNHPVWFTLESVASYVPYACVVIHTASCQIFKQTSNMPLVERLHLIEVTARAIYERSLPLFRRMMERGQVRISILEKGRYNIENCGTWDISTIAMNIHFWREEFLDGIDSDTLLFVQDDAVLCRYLDIDPWKHFAFVGGPWNPLVFPGGCDGMRNIWRGWAPQCQMVNPDMELPHLCTPGHAGLQGNGGLSLRNRQWMIHVIETCPSEFSGLESYASIGHQQEDVYFTTISNGIHAPMPSAFEASLLFTESLFPEQTLQQFFPLSSGEIEESVQRLWGNETGMLMYNRMHNFSTYLTEYEFNNTSGENLPVLYTIPFGLHKPWDYHSHDILGGVQLQQECKFLKFMYNILI
jgi:hypothetical protein